MEPASRSWRARRSAQRATVSVLSSRGRSSNDSTSSDTGLPPSACRFQAASKRSSASPGAPTRSCSTLAGFDIVLEVIAHLLHRAEGVRRDPPADAALAVLVDDQAAIVEAVALSLELHGEPAGRQHDDFLIWHGTP